MALADLIDTHRGAFEYDWRTRLRLPLSVVGTSRMSWGEAFRLTLLLIRDPSAHVAAAAAGWEHPVSREALVLMDKFDLDYQVAWVQGGKKGPRPQPYPRPWGAKTTRHMGKTRLSQEAVLAILRDAGHGSQEPAQI